MEAEREEGAKETPLLTKQGCGDRFQAIETAPSGTAECRPERRRPRSADGDVVNVERLSGLERETRRGHRRERGQAQQEDEASFHR